MQHSPAQWGFSSFFCSICSPYWYCIQFLLCFLTWGHPTEWHCEKSGKCKLQWGAGALWKRHAAHRQQLCPPFNSSCLEVTVFLAQPILCNLPPSPASHSFYSRVQKREKGYFKLLELKKKKKKQNKTQTKQAETRLVALVPNTLIYLFVSLIMT